MKSANLCMFSIAVLMAIGLSFVSISPAIAQGDTWVTKASMPTGREGAAAAVIGNTIYVVRGYHGHGTGINEAYNTLTDTWTTLAEARSYGAEGSAAAAVGMEGLMNVYSFGGRVVATVIAYNPGNNTWWEVASMPTARAGTAAVTVGSNIYVIGGRTGDSPGSGIALATVEVYSPSNDTWWTASSMLTARSDLAAIALGGIIYTFGGWTNDPYDHSLSVVEAYDPANNTWWSLPVMPTARNHALAGLCGSDIHVITGTDASGPPFDWKSLVTHEVYTPSNSTWWPGGAAPIPHGRWEGVVGTASNSIYVIGGGGSGGHAEPITDLNEQYVCPTAIQQWPEAEFTWSPTTPDEGEVIQFTDLSVDSDGTIVSWDWDFGDGAHHSSQQNPTHVFGDNGAFTVTLTVTDNDGLDDSVQHNITVSNVAPIVDSLPVLTSNEGQTASFPGHVTDPGSDDLTFAWTWQYRSACDVATTYLNAPPNPDPYPSPDVNPMSVTDSATCQYGDNGVFTVTLTVTDDDGGSTTVTTTLTVNNVAPTVDSPPELIVSEGEGFFLTAKASDPGSDDLAFIWDWGDGPTDAVVFYNNGIGPDSPKSPWGVYPFEATHTMSHTWGDNGNFTVTLTVIDDDRGTTISQSVVVADNIDPTISNLTFEVFYNEPRTQGYWNFQCVEKLPSPDHVGIQQEFIDYISSHSRVFSGISTKDEVCDNLGSLDNSNMTQKAMRQLMALWLNVASDKLNLSSEMFIPQRNTTMNLLELIVWIEDTILNDDKDNMETAKDLADEMNNGNLIPYAVLTFRGTASDPGSDDLIFTWDWGDGTSTEHIYYNNGLGPDPYPSPDVNPITVTDTAMHSYVSAGTYTVALTVSDDDGGFQEISQYILLGMMHSAYHVQITESTFNMTVNAGYFIRFTDPGVDSLPMLIINDEQTAPLPGHATGPGSDDLVLERSFDEIAVVAKHAETTKSAIRDRISATRIQVSMEDSCSQLKTLRSTPTLLREHMQ